VAGIADKLNKAYQMRGNQDYRHRATAGVDSYDIEKVIQKHWLPTLEKIQAKIDATPKADNLSQNLDVLR
jgi:hypothetical protein